MKKTEIYVPIANKKEAKRAKAVLEAINETVSEKYYSNTFLDCRDVELYYSKTLNGWILGSKNSNSERYNIKQLIELLVKQSDGESTTQEKIAVRVDNEKEFNALMKYYDGLGWKPWSDHNIKNAHIFGEAIDFHDEYRSAGILIQEGEGYKIIPFAEFAAEHNIKLPMLTSEDGVDLYDGDFHSAVYKNDKCINGWQLGCTATQLRTDSSCVTDPEGSKAFSTKQAALDWIDAQKPEKIVISEKSKYPITVYKKPVGGDLILMDMSNYTGNFGISFSIEEIKGIVSAYEKLHNNG